MERVLVSPPKAGRTWVRTYMMVYCGLAKIDNPDIVYAHDDWGKPDKRILLLRDERDVLVSLYFQLTIRVPPKWHIEMSMSDFVRDPEHGLPKLNECVERWLKYSGDQMVIRYEDLFNPIWESILNYFEIPINRDYMTGADDICKFENIKRNLCSFNQRPDSWRYLAIENGKETLTPKNPEAHKFRRGEVGGYVNYLNEDDINYITTERIGQNGL